MDNNQQLAEILIKKYYSDLKYTLPSNQAKEATKLIAYRLKKVREDFAKLPIAELSKLSKIDKTTIYRYESGNFFPPPKRLYILLSTMNYPVENFISHADSYSEWYNENIHSRINDGEGLPNVFELMYKINKYLEHPLSYKKDGEIVRLPVKYQDTLKKYVETCSAFLDLLECDEDQFSESEILIKNIQIEEIEYN